MKTNLLKSITSLRQARGHYDIIKISHSGFSQDWYFINNSEDLEYNGNIYLSFPFALTSSGQKEQLGASVVLSNIDNRIAKELSNAVSFPNENIRLEHTRITLEVFGNKLTAGETGITGSYEVISPSITKEAVTFLLNVRNSLSINSGSLTFNSTNFPNLYL